MKRAIVRNSHEYQVWVNAFNGKMNCYTTVYDFEHFAVDKAVENTCIKDRMFLDFDAHGQPLQTAFDDLKMVLNHLIKEDIYFVPYFSGNGFHVIVYGEVADDIRSIQQTFTDLAKIAPTLDNTGIQINRLKRIPNTVNLSSKGPHFCIPITKEDIKIRKLPNQISGLVVTKVGNTSPLLNSIEANSIIIEAQKTRIKNAQDLEKIVKDVLKSNQKTILFAIYNNQNQRRYIGVKLD